MNQGKSSLFSLILLGDIVRKQSTPNERQTLPFGKWFLERKKKEEENCSAVDTRIRRANVTRKTCTDSTAACLQAKILAA